jgi:uncharacterized iron-regulated membrane protein
VVTDSRTAARPRNGYGLVAGTRLRAFLYRWHRRLGLAAAPVVVVLVVTGILLDWAHELGLDRTNADAGWVRAVYGLPPAPAAVAYRAGGRWLISIGDAIYLDAQPVARDAGPLVGAAAAGALIVAASAESLFVLTADGDMVERLSGPLLPGRIDALGAGDSVVVISGGEAYAADAALTRWAPAPMPPALATPAPAPEALLAEVRADHGGARVTWERVLQDAHSGRLFGRFGPYVIDLAAVLLGLLVVSGLTNALRRG